MNARTLIITAGAIVALAAPAVASAKLSPASQYQKNLAAKKHAAKHAKHVVKRPRRTGQIYTYYPAPASQPAKSLQEQEAAYNADLVAHGLDPVEFPDTSTASATSDDSSSTSASGETSSTSTSDSTPAAASFAAAPATSIAAVDDSDDC
jgi:hypothetical protein